MNKTQAIQRIINKYDPMELLEDGSPEDEYSSESLSILRISRSDLNLETFSNKVREIFVNSFGISPKYNLSYLDKMAEDLFNILRKG